ncbi:MAG: MarR family winged helix-turn-helix transcriptional regulator [Myxococcales bacterium]
MSRPLPVPVAGSDASSGRDVLGFLRLLWAIDHGLQTHSKRMSRAFGVTGPQRLVLRILGRHGHLTSGQLAALLHLHASTLTGIVRRLQLQGFVTRQVDPRDRRRYHLALTDRGRAVNSMRVGTVEAELEAALGDLTPGQLAAAEYALESIGLRLSENRQRRR